MPKDEPHQPDQSQSMFANIKNDFMSSLVVFLVALPLCIGIAVAVGVSPARALITGIIGGLFVGFIAGSPLQVSGPAAGLFVIVADLLANGQASYLKNPEEGVSDISTAAVNYSLMILGTSVFLAGLIQVAAGRLKLGQWFRAVSPAVIKGMLAGIGILILISQFHVMLDHKAMWHGEKAHGGLQYMATIPEAIMKCFSSETVDFHIEPTPDFHIEPGDEPANGTASINAITGHWTYTPDAGFNGSDSFTVSVTDNEGNVKTDNEGNDITQRISITVNPINDDGTFGGGTSATTPENNTTSGTLTFTNTADGNTTPNFRIESGDDQAASGTASINAITGDWTYTPDAGFNGSDSFTASVTDDEGNVETQRISITVNPINDDGTFGGVTSVTTSENNTTSETLTFGNEAANGTASINAITGHWTYTPDAGFNGSDSFTVSVTDNEGNDITQRISITVNPINDDGTFGGGTSATTYENNTTSGTLTFTNTADGNTTPNFRIESEDDEAANGTASINAITGDWTYTPDAGFNGSDSFTASVTDDEGNVETQRISITVNPINDDGTFGGVTSVTTSENNTTSGTLTFGGKNHLLAALTGILAIACFIGWPKVAPKSLKFLPAALVGIAIATVFAYATNLQIQRLDVPENMFKEVTQPNGDWVWLLIHPTVLAGAFVIALVASAETLLCATAVDQLHQGPRTNYDKELTAQGIGNILCGLVGALPMTGVIVRSSANVNSGAKTRLSTILHGLWLLIFVAYFPSLLTFIPRSALGALLVYTGIKLVNIRDVKKLWNTSHGEAGIYFATVLTIICTDLLIGVVVGIVLSAFKLLARFSDFEIELTTSEDRKEASLSLKGAATFIALPKLARELERVPNGTRLRIDFDQLTYIDHACLDLIMNWAPQHTNLGGELTLDWDKLQGCFTSKDRAGVTPEP